MPRKRVARKRVTTRRRVTPRRVRTKRSRKQRGRGFKDTLRKAHDFVKKRRIISGGLAHFGHPRLAAAARQLGYGRQSGGARRRVRRTKKVMRGKGRIGEALGGLAGSLLPF